jgi:hypothetical protein
MVTFREQEFIRVTKDMNRRDRCKVIRDVCKCDIGILPESHAQRRRTKDAETRSGRDLCIAVTLHAQNEQIGRVFRYLIFSKRDSCRRPSDCRPEFDRLDVMP